MDRFEAISSECQITSSAEEILGQVIADAKSAAAGTSKRKSPAQDDLRISQKRTDKKTCCTDVDATTSDSGVSKASAKEIGASKAKDPSEMDLGFFERMKFHVARSKLPNLLSLKESGVLSEKELGYLERIQFFISKGALPNIGFLKRKGDSSVSLKQGDFSKSSAADAYPSLAAEGSGNDDSSLGFGESRIEEPQISREKRLGNLGSPKCTIVGSSNNKLTAKNSEQSIQRNAGSASPGKVNVKESCIAEGSSPLEIDPGHSKSKGDSPGELSPKEPENLKKYNALEASLARVTCISKGKPLLGGNSSLRRSYGTLSRSVNARITDSAGEDLGSGRNVEEDYEEDTAPTDKFAMFRYRKSGNNSPNCRTSTLNPASQNLGIERKLPPWIRGPMKEKVDASPLSLRASQAEKAGASGRAKISNAALLRNEVIRNLVDFMKAISRESDRCTGDEDILEVAERAGCTFPTPRWWPPWEGAETNIRIPHVSSSSPR